MKTIIVTEPRVKLINVKTFEGHDGQGLNADIQINGVKCIHVHDGAYGGEMEYTVLSNDEITKANIKKLNDYIEQCPNETYNIGGTIRELKFDLDMYVEKLLEKIEHEKIQKKMLKLQKTSILIGIPNSDIYSYLNYKKPLSEISDLQTKVNSIKLKYCTNGMTILNTNLNELDITI